MTDLEFIEACADVYQREIDKGRSKNEALRRSEEFRRNYIIQHAKLAARARTE